MAGKAEDQAGLKRKLRRRSIWIVIVALLILVVVCGLAVSGIFQQPPSAKFPLTAAIIDQLGADFPDPSFISYANRTLSNDGFNVTYYNQSINVDFFRTLASSNYGVIILRAHSAQRIDGSTVDLFTSEPYNSDEYVQEQHGGLLTEAMFYYKPGEYFALSSLFISSLAGRFPNSIVIAMGCDSLKPGCEQLAAAFIGKGAKAYIGWSNMVLPSDTDAETEILLDMLFNQNKTVQDAVGSTNPHLYYGNESLTNSTQIAVETQMGFYPASAGTLKVSQLIAQSDKSSTPTVSIVSAGFLTCLVLNEPRDEQHKKAALRDEREEKQRDSRP